MRLVKISVFLYIIFGYILTVISQIPAFPLEFRVPHQSHFGLGWPHVLRVATGHEALLKLSKSLVNQQHCYVRTPQGETIDMSQLPATRYERWSDGCGIRIKNIAKTDEGRWKLTSVRAEESLIGYSEVHVLDTKSSYDGTPITLSDGTAGAYVNLTTLENYYCMVAQPFAQSSLIPGHCEITLEKTSRAIQGTWRILLGIPGQVAELPGEKQVTVEGEHLDVGQIYDNVHHKLHLYCNIVHSEKEISFCRFQHTSSNSGYNVVDGLSDGHFSYYGNGFMYKHCGITVEIPTAQDFSSWRCSVGVTERDSHNVIQRSAMQALISVMPQTLSISNDNLRNEISNANEEERTIFTQIGSILNLSCQAEESLTYCWFQHPNGSQFTPAEKFDSEDQLFWYSGESLQMGHCGISFINADESFSGKWTCHMGSSVTLGVEISDSMTVRVTGPLAANQKEINATAYSSTTLHCLTSGSRTSLKYCRFVSPDFLGLNIDGTVIKDKAVLGRYYFTPNMSLDYGDCSLTIDPVRYEDIGLWTCAALIVGQTLESHDTIQLFVTEPTGKLSTGSILGIVFGILGAFAIIGVVIYRKKIYSRFTNLYQRRTESMASVARGSINSDSSSESPPIP